MNVRAMLGHLVGVLDRSRCARQRRRSLRGDRDRLSPDDRLVRRVGEVRAGDAADAWSDDAVLERPMALPWIEGSGAEVLASYFSELTVHTWDLATATGQQPDWDDTVVTAALEARQILPAENRRALFEEISAAMGLDEVAHPVRRGRPRSPTTPPPSTASSPGTAGIRSADPDGTDRPGSTSRLSRGTGGEKRHLSGTKCVNRWDTAWNRAFWSPAIFDSAVFLLIQAATQARQGRLEP